MQNDEKFTPAIHDEKNLARIKRGKWKRGRKSRDPACIVFLVTTVRDTLNASPDPKSNGVPSAGPSSASSCPVQLLLFTQRSALYTYIPARIVGYRRGTLAQMRTLWTHLRLQLPVYVHLSRRQPCSKIGTTAQHRAVHFHAFSQRPGHSGSSARTELAGWMNFFPYFKKNWQILEIHDFS